MAHRSLSHSPETADERAEARFLKKTGDSAGTLDVSMTAGRSTDVGMSTATAMLSRVDISSSSTLFVIGFGDGHVVDVLEQRGWQGTIVVFAPDTAALDAVLARRDYRPWLASGRLRILRGPRYEGADHLSSSLNPDIEKPLIALDPHVMRSHGAEVKEVARLVVKTWFGALANKKARRATAGTYLVNTLRNASAIADGRDVSALTDLLPGVPAVVVGAGPSLDRNIADLQRFRDRAIVVAVDTALRPLLAAGIEPDVVVAVDPGEANASHLTCLPPCRDTYFVAEGSIDPEAVRQFAGRTFFFRVADHHPWPWLRQLGIERAQLRAWGSVLTTAFDLALSMGCNPVVLAGADLAFTGGRPYARGTTYEELWYRESAAGRSYEDIWAAQVATWPQVVETGVDGIPVSTAAHLRSFRDWITTEAGRLPDRTIINGSGSGILVGSHIRQVPLADALSGLPALDAATRGRVPHAYRSTPRGPSRAAALKLASAEGIDAALLSTWHEFAMGGVTEDDILRAMGVTAGPMAAQPLDRQADASRTFDVDASPDRARTVSLQAICDYVSAARPATMLATDPAAAAYAVEVQATTGGHCKINGAGGKAPAPLVIMTCTDPGSRLGSQIEEAWSLVAPGGRLFVIDHTGSRGGAAIRRALFAFFERHPETDVYHGRFFDPHGEMSWIEARSASPITVQPDLDKFHPFHDGIARRLTPHFIEHFKPRSMLDIGCGPGYWLRAFEANGVPDVSGAEDAALLAAGGTVAPAGVWSGDLASFEPATKVDLCLCLGAARRMPAATAEAVVAACTRASDTVVFSSSLPCMGPWAGYINQQPWSAWHRLFLQHGFLPHDELRPLIEARWPRYLSSADFLVTVYRRSPIGALPDAMATYVLDATARIDDQVIQTQWYRRALDAAKQPSVDGLAGVRCEWLEIPAARMIATGRPGVRQFRFRTSAAKFALGGHVTTITEANQPLERVAPTCAITPGDGQFSVGVDAVMFAATDQSDPRHNGRAYAVRVPAHVAWLERLPMTTIVEQGL